jgi:MFS family permease
VLFFVIQARSRQPLLRLGIFTAPQLGAANVAQLLLGAAWIPMWFFLNLYLQQVLGAGAFASGAALLPMTALIVIGMIFLAPRLQARFGAKPMIVSGLLLLSAGLGSLALVRPDGNYVVDVLPASLVAALGMALAFIPSLGTAISSARPEETGVAAGLVSTSYQVGSAVGLAALTAVAAIFTGAGSDAPALTDGYSAAFAGAAIVALLGAVVVAVALKPAVAAAEEQVMAQAAA